MLSTNYGGLVPEDESLTHQIVDTFATVSQSDPSWTEKIWTIAHARDNSLQAVLGVGKYTNRGVFDGAKLLIPAGFFVMAIRLQRARAQSAEAMLRLVRDGAVAAGAVVAALGLVAALAFEQAFLFFHEVFFPQGNFLFDPATSNLVRLYPDWYWQGITFRIGLSFIAVAAVVAVAASAGLWRARSTLARSLH